MFVSDKVLQLVQYLRIRPEPIQVKHLSGVPLKGRPLRALTANIRLGWKSLRGTNTLTYYKNL